MGNYATTQSPTNKMIGVAAPGVISQRPQGGRPQIQKEVQPGGLFSSAVNAAAPAAAAAPASTAFNINRGDPNKRIAAPWQVVDTSAADAAAAKATADAATKAKADTEAKAKSDSEASAKAASEQAAANAAMQSAFWQQYEINKQAREEATYAAQNTGNPPSPPPVEAPQEETDPYERWKAGGRQGPRPEGY